jgi:hypothetical protein
MTTASWSLVVSGAALVASTVALVVTITLLRRNRPRVKVTWEGAVPLYRDGRKGERHVAVTATNDGYGATTITAWGFSIDGTADTLLETHPDPWLPCLPHRLGPQDAVTWHAPVKRIAASLVQSGRTDAALHAFVTLASGTQVVARVPITASVFPPDEEREPVLDLRPIALEELHLEAVETEQ